MENNVFKTLNVINVNEHTEKKKDLTYLSWAWAWGEVKKVYPDASYTVVRDPVTSKPYFYDESLGYMVLTSVTIMGQCLEMWLPVMDGANKAMKDKPYKYTTKYGEGTVASATMFDINKTLMRCLTKNLAMFGLGLYIYAGEDMPEDSNDNGKIHPDYNKAPAQVLPSHGIESKHTADVEALKEVAAKAKAKYNPDPVEEEISGDEWVDAKPVPVEQKTISGVIKKYYPLNGKKPHVALIDGEYYSTYHEGIGGQLAELEHDLVQVTFRNEPYEFKGETRINHVIDEVKKA